MGFPTWVKKNNLNISVYQETEITRLVLKYLLRNGSFSLAERIYFADKQRKYSKNTSIASFRRYSYLSCYTRSFFRYFKLSRHECKWKASNGFLPGMRKSSF